MRKFDTLAWPCKKNGMFTHNISPANRMHSNLVLRSLTHKTLSSVTNALVVVELTCVRNNLSQPSCRAAWRVFLQAMVKFENLNIKVWTQHPIRFLGQPEQEVHTDTEIRSQQDRGPRGGGSQFLQLIVCMSGCAYH